MWQNFTQRIRRSFSEAADQYDILANLHREIGRELVKKHTHLDAASILDVGTGTGYVAGKVKFFFPESRVVGIDLAHGMLEKAQEKHGGIDWIEADAQALPFKAGSFDLIVSNLAYQWSVDLAGAFKQARGALSSKGQLAITLFGYHTCQELFSSLEETGSLKKELKRLPKLEDVKEALSQAGFKEIMVDYERIHVQFKDLWDLLGWLKAIGANELSSGQFIGPQALLQANEYCKKQYPYHEGIRSTFEVIWVHAKV